MTAIPQQHAIPMSRFPPLDTSFTSRRSYQPTRSSRLRTPSDTSSSSSFSSSASTSSLQTPDEEGPYVSLVPTQTRPKFTTNLSSMSLASNDSSCSCRAGMHGECSDDEDHSGTDVENAPVISPFPKRAAVSKSTSAINGISPVSPQASTPPARTPSFPVSRPLRPFDSISNAMGTHKPARAPLAPVSAVSQCEKPPMGDIVGHSNGEIQMKPKSNKRSNVLLEPPKNNRFANGFFVLNMTQDEFKSRAW